MRRLLALTLFVAAGCAGPPTSSLVKPAAAASLSPGPYKLSEHHLLVDNVAYRYLVLVPNTCAGKLSPLVITLHGRGGTAEGAMWGLDHLAVEHNFILVAPQGQDRKWRDLDGDVLQKRDLAFFARLLDLVPTLGGDPKRVYVTGFSNGGGMAFVLGSVFSRRIAAIAPGGASIGALDEKLVYHTIPDPQRPIPVLIFHGMQDPISGYGMETFAVGQQDVARWWAVRDHTALTPEHSVIGKGHVLADRYRGKNNLEVVLLSYKDLGHAWPSSEDSVTGLNFNETLWKFLSRYSL